MKTFGGLLLLCAVAHFCSGSEVTSDPSMVSTEVTNDPSTMVSTGVTSEPSTVWATEITSQHSTTVSTEVTSQHSTMVDCSVYKKYPVVAIPCPITYLPVCGTNYITYGNSCLLCAEVLKSGGKVQLLHEGQC